MSPLVYLNRVNSNELEIILNRSQKEKFVSELKKDLSETNLLVVTHYLGLNVNEIEDLRSKMRDADVNFKITKNRLTKIALTGTSFENIKELFQGPTAVAYSEDAIQAARIAVNFSKDNNKLKIIGGSFEGKLIDEDKVKFLASLPSLDELRARLICLMQTPAQKIASILQVPSGNIARVLKAYSENKAKAN